MYSQSGTSKTGALIGTALADKEFDCYVNVSGSGSGGVSNCSSKQNGKGLLYGKDQTNVVLQRFHLGIHTCYMVSAVDTNAQF